jgi:hypothetical protein
MQVKPVQSATSSISLVSTVETSQLVLLALHMLNITVLILNTKQKAQTLVMMLITLLCYPNVFALWTSQKVTPVHSR